MSAEDCTAKADDAAQFLIEAHQWAQRAMRSRSDGATIKFWSSCAATAYRALGTTQAAVGEKAAALATQCTDEFLKLALQSSSRRWSEGLTQIGNLSLTVEFRGLSPYLNGPLAIARAQDVPVRFVGGTRYFNPGFGVPLAVMTPRCDDRPLCNLLPPEGVFRWATAWFEADPARDASMPRLVIADPLTVSALAFGDRRYPLAIDTSAFYLKGVQTSKLSRMGVWGLLGGDEVRRRAGLYLLEDYDPNKRPIVMIHGLGSSPLVWARLSNAVWGSPDLRARFQVWHVVYPTEAPLLVARRRVKGYLDAGWQVLDPEGDDPARSGVVLIGHSLGGVISRLLSVDSGDDLWSAAFTVPPSALRGEPADIEMLESIFRFQPYPGISRAIFLGAPHGGSPSADNWFGRLFRGAGWSPHTGSAVSAPARERQPICDSSGASRSLSAGSNQQHFVAADCSTHPSGRPITDARCRHSLPHDCRCIAWSSARDRRRGAARQRVAAGRSLDAGGGVESQAV